MRRGQSAVVGNVLLVALVVVAAVSVAVYGNSAVGGLAEPPEISLDASQATGASDYESRAALQVEHGGGAELAVDDLSILVDGERVGNRSNLTARYPGGSFAIGDQLVIEQTGDAGFTGGETVTLLYHAGDDTFRLRSFTVEGGGPGAGPSVFGFEESSVGQAPDDPWQTEERRYPEPTLEVRDSHAASGERSLYLSTGATGHDGASIAKATIAVNLTDVAEIRIDYHDQEDAQIRLNGSTRASDGHGLQPSPNSWSTVSIDVSGDTGVVDLTLFNSEQTTDSGAASVYFDDIRFYEADGDRIAPEDVLP